MPPVSSPRPPPGILLEFAQRSHLRYNFADMALTVPAVPEVRTQLSDLESQWEVLKQGEDARQVLVEVGEIELQTVSHMQSLIASTSHC